MAGFPTTLATIQRPVAGLDLSPAGREAADYLEYRGLEVVEGFLPENQPEILNLAQTSEGIQEYCTNDEKTRFPTLEAMMAWAEKGRGQFLLRTIKERAANGYLWTGEEKCDELPHHPNTSAYRSLVPGTGAAFAIVGIEASRIMFDRKHGYGLETWATNHDAIKMYRKIGAVLVDTRSEEKNKKTGAMEPVTRPTLQTGPPVFWKDGQPVRTDTRLFMSLPEEFPTGLFINNRR
jgi:hypothetical protein